MCLMHLKSSTKKEQWKPLKDGYLISSSGRIKNQNGKILKLYINNSGYVRACLYASKVRKHVFLHIKVVEAFGDRNGNFLPHDASLRNVGLSIDHVDGNKKNNKVTNLEIVTHSENCKRRSARREQNNVKNK